MTATDEGGEPCLSASCGTEQLSGEQADRIRVAMEAEVGQLIPVGQGRVVFVDTARLSRLAARHEQPDVGARWIADAPSGHQPAVGRRESTTADEAPAGRVMQPVPPGPTPQTASGLGEDAGVGAGASEGVPARPIRAAAEVLAWGVAVALIVYAVWFAGTLIGFLWLLYGPN